MAIEKFTAETKDPDAILDYGFDWNNWLSSGDSVINSTWIIDGASDNSIDITQQQLISNFTFVWLSGGIEGKKYKLLNTINTSQGRRDQKSFILPIKSV